MAEVPEVVDGEAQPDEENLDDSGEGSVTLQEVLQSEMSLEEDARAVLGAADDRNCSYEKGHLFRQPLYSCATCCDLKAKPAGICLGCSLHCHDGHELHELYTKRNFRCECGNDKFGGVKCNLRPEKEAETTNRYNQNFSGLYCFCHAKYPDPEDPVEDEMLQCCACEDWFHSRHLGTEVPAESGFAEMICSDCVAKLPFLTFYSQPTAAFQDGINAIEVPNVCKLEDLKLQFPGDLASETLFFGEDWRKRLCRCEKCQVLYREKDCEFLLSSTDPVQHYEDLGMMNTSGSSVEEKGLKALEGVDRTVAVEMIHGYNNLKEELADYLKKFADNGKTVREEDIKEFFEGFKGAKRQKSQVFDKC